MQVVSVQAVQTSSSGAGLQAVVEFEDAKVTQAGFDGLEKIKAWDSVTQLWRDNPIASYERQQRTDAEGMVHQIDVYTVQVLPTTAMLMALYSGQPVTMAFAAELNTHDTVYGQNWGENFPIGYKKP